MKCVHRIYMAFNYTFEAPIKLWGFNYETWIIGDDKYVTEKVQNKFMPNLLNLCYQIKGKY